MSNYLKISLSYSDENINRWKIFGGQLANVYPGISTARRFLVSALMWKDLGNGHSPFYNKINWKSMTFLGLVRELRSRNKESRLLTRSRCRWSHKHFQDNFDTLLEAECGLPWKTESAGSCRVRIEICKLWVQSIWGEPSLKREVKNKKTREIQSPWHLLLLQTWNTAQLPSKST